ncbi:MAG: trypsin-like serine protease [Candidatus Nanopelagicales bacterium]
MTRDRALILTVGATCLALSFGAAPALASSEVPLTPKVVNGLPGPDARLGSLVAVADRNTYESDGLFDAQFCGGTAVTPRLIVTAAHCVSERDRVTAAASLIVARTGDGRLSDPDARVVRVVKVTVNPGYNEVTASGDIAVLQLSADLPGVVPVSVATPDDDQTLLSAGAPLVVGGWGATRRNGTQAADLYRWGDLVAFPRNSCGGDQSYEVDGVRFRGYDRFDASPATMVCASGVRNGAIVDSCSGDSGGPLLGRADDGYRLVGVVSWGPELCASTLPGVYTRVSAMNTFLISAGVPITPDPNLTPEAPAIVDVTVGTRTAVVTVEPSAEGLTADRYLVSATLTSGSVTTCGMKAPSQRASAQCTLSGLKPGKRYTLTAVSLRQGASSTNSAPVKIRPVGPPNRARITSVTVNGNRSATFSVQRLSNNGSSLTRREVTCHSPGLPTRVGEIEKGGIAVVTNLTRNRTYSCRARLANDLGKTASVSRVLRVT